MWTCCYESLTSLVSSVLAEVLDETASEVCCLSLPLSCISVSVTWIEDCRIYAWESCWNLKVEYRDLLCRSLEDCTKVTLVLGIHFIL